MGARALYSIARFEQGLDVLRGTNSVMQKTPLRRYLLRLSVMAIVLTVFASAGSVPGSQGGATLTGIVRFKGPIPLPQKVTVRRDASFCGDTVTIQPLVVQASTHGVLGAVVSFTDQPAQSIEAAPPLTIIKNRNCAFVSRISTSRVGALIEVGNDDPVLHNTHVRSDGKTLLNVAMVAHGQNIQKQVKKSGVLDVKCDAHKFMQGYVLAFDHPYFATTDEAGRFQIAGIPPGRRRIITWHETLGILQQEVNVPAQGEISIHIDYPSSP